MNRLEVVGGFNGAVELDLEPEQPEEIVRAIAGLLAEEESSSHPGPWWQAGIDEALDA